MIALEKESSEALCLTVRGNKFQIVTPDEVTARPSHLFPIVFSVSVRILSCQETSFLNAPVQPLTGCGCALCGPVRRIAYSYRFPDEVNVPQLPSVYQ